MMKKTSVSAARQIKKYTNRKLYDVQGAAYVSMLELGGIVARGNEVQVVDDSSGDDVTLQTLARALYERVKRCRAVGSTLDPILKFELARIMSQVPGLR